MSSGAFFTALLEPIFYKRKIIGYEVLFGIIIIFGLIFIFSLDTNHLLGMCYAFVSAFLSSLFTILNGKLANESIAVPSVISFYELLFGIAVITVFILISPLFSNTFEGFSTYFFKLSAMDWVWLLILSSICTAYAFIVSVKIMKYLSPFTVILTVNLEPVYGIILAFLIFGNTEKMNTNFYIGTCIILSTVLLNGFLKNIEKKKKSRYIV